MNHTTFQLAGPWAAILKLQGCTVSVGASLDKFYFCVCVSTMACNEYEESMNAPDPDPPYTPPKLTGNGGACRVDPDGQMESEDDDSNDLFTNHIRQPSPDPGLRSPGAQGKALQRWFGLLWNGPMSPTGTTGS